MEDGGEWTEVPARASGRAASKNNAAPTSKKESAGAADARTGARGGTFDRDAVYYFEERGTEYLESPSAPSDPLPPARTERVLVYATYRRRRCAHPTLDVTYTPWAFAGYDARGLAYNSIVGGLAKVLQASPAAQAGEQEHPRNLKMLSQLLAPEEVRDGSVANVGPEQLDGIETLGRWRWELYDVDVQPPSWRYGAAEDGAFPFGLSALDVEVIEQLQEAADSNAHDGASDVRLDGASDVRVSRSWFGPADDAIVVAFASVNTRPTAAVRLLRIDPRKANYPAEEGSLGYRDGVRTIQPNHDPVDPPVAPQQPSHQELDHLGRASRAVEDKDFLFS